MRYDEQEERFIGPEMEAGIITGTNMDPMQASRYYEFVKRSNMAPDDTERTSLFFILSGNDDLYSKVNHIYNFDENSIRPECFSTVDLCSSSKALVRLGFNLFNGYTDDYTDVLSLFCNLDSQNSKLAISAIMIRKGLMGV